MYRNVYLTSLSCFLIFTTGVAQQNLECSNPNGKMKIYAYRADMFKKGGAAEYMAYQMLTQYPTEKNVNYLAVPWIVLFNEHNLDQLPDIQLNGGFTVCQHIQFKEILPILKKIGIDTLFTPHAKRETVYEGIHILPFPHYPMNGVEPASCKDILYSFIGFHSWQKSRKKLFQMPVSKDCIIIERPRPYYWLKEGKEEQMNEYRDILARSRYSLCPRGTGPSTLRFWESLQAGAIPILLSDAMWLPDGVDWDHCVIRVPEKDVLKINEILQNISCEQEATMRAHCLQAHQLFSGKNFVSNIKRYYEN